MAKRAGVRFDSTVTLGRQDLLITAARLQEAFTAYGEPLDAAEADTISQKGSRFSEPLFRKLGAKSVDSIDASAFEDATIVHDLNQPLPPELEGRYTLAFDGGTLEHIFDFPRALRNFLELPAVGGHVIMASPANNQMGHGFYQFSPELYFRALCIENGYRLLRLILVPAYSEGVWLSVRDPVEVRGRVGLNSTLEELDLFAVAQRVAKVALFAQPPQQSDYAFEWTNRPNKGRDESRLAFFDAATAQASATRRVTAVKRALRALLPAAVQSWLQRWRATRHLAKRPDSRYFTPLAWRPDEDRDLPRGGARSPADRPGKPQ
jgi:hypothetical protein